MAGVGRGAARPAEGNITRHPDMPNWQFEEVDMEGLIAYLETVQMPDGEQRRSVFAARRLQIVLFALPLPPE